MTPPDPVISLDTTGRSPGETTEKVDVVSEWASIPAMARWSAGRFGNRVAVIDGAARLTFAEVGAEMTAVARSLMAMGVEPGDRVGLWAPNSAAWIAAALGIQAAGAWLVPINTRMKGDEAAYIVAKTDARVLFAPGEFLGTDYLAMLRRAAPDLRALRRPVILPGPGQYGGREWDEFIALGSDVSTEAASARLDAVGRDDISDIIFTSGTTGRPKGVMLRHGTSLQGFALVNESYGLAEHDRYMVPTPFFHCMGYKSGWMLSLMTGATTFPLAVFDAEEVLAAIEREKITFLPGSPTLFSGLLDHPRRGDFDLSSLRCVMVSAASVPASLVHRIRDEFGLDRVFTGYGLTENHAVVAFTQPGDGPEVVANTVGKLLPRLEARIVDDEGNDLPLGEQGEILLRGFMHMAGYYDDDEATAKAIVDGWLHTGDIGTIDADDYMRVTGRKKEMFIVGGFNVAPAEVERALLELDTIAQAVVMGTPDDYHGEVGVAFVIPRPGADLSAEAVIAYAREHLANYKVPRRVFIVDAFPLNATGKVQKDELLGLMHTLTTGQEQEETGP